MDEQQLRDILTHAYDSVFEDTGEGWNGEWPSFVNYPEKKAQYLRDREEWVQKFRYQVNHYLATGVWI